MKTISLTSRDIEPLYFDLGDGAGMRWVFERRLGREERQKLLKKHGKGKGAVEILDFGRLAARAVKYIELDEVTVKDSSGKEHTGTIERRDVIASLLDSPALPEEIFDAVVEHVMVDSTLGEDEGNS